MHILSMCTYDLRKKRASGSKTVEGVIHKNEVTSWQQRVCNLHYLNTGLFPIKTCYIYLVFMFTVRVLYNEKYRRNIWTRNQSKCHFFL